VNSRVKLKKLSVEPPVIPVQRSVPGEMEKNLCRILPLCQGLIVDQMMRGTEK
jgi:hypothetical protein